ncbi:hypothetical protein DOK76_00665 [Vagococcus sp. DIV0080]|uniref:Uncharacterized protein n=1 Tax=Candidatus Vagococcus giribetii TaxID=2230876 RepID=A0ABS3HP91_9ENTE|nr:hypothetical protein [Vagococcus sp. DIV0080]MBO0475558.1 hypothetical protein [Vagococcus sp. DIV0080]
MNQPKTYIDRKALYIPIIDHALKEAEESEILNDTLLAFGEEAYKQSLRLHAYNWIVEALDGKKLLDTLKHGSRDESVSLILEQSRDINILETEIYNIKNGGQDEILNAFYGNISNEKIELFEIIEECIK